MRKPALWIVLAFGLGFHAPVQAQVQDAKTASDLLLAAGAAEQKGDSDAAIAAYSKLLAMRPGDEPLLLDRGGAYAGKKDYAHALADFSQAITLKPGDAMAHDDRGILYLDRHDYDAALADFNEALRLNPDYAGALGYRAIVYDFKRDTTHAIANYGALIKMQPDNAEALNARCWDRAYANRELDAALADCSAALKIIRNRQAAAELRDSRGFVYFRKGDMASAIADYDAALTLQPRSAETLYKRGLAKNRSGKDGKADITAALKLDPHAGDDMNELGLKP